MSQNTSRIEYVTILKIVNPTTGEERYRSRCGDTNFNFKRDERRQEEEMKEDNFNECCLIANTFMQKRTISLDITNVSCQH